MRPRSRTLRPAALLALGVALAACARRPAEQVADTVVVQAPPKDAAPGGTDAGMADIRRLEREARALARTEGCSGAGQCAVAPVGDRPCGGPRTYVAYCRLTTDSAALFRKLDELARREREYNQKSGMVSTCEFREPPVPTLAGGRCGAPGAP